MRIDRLRLLAFGPFTDSDIELAPERLNVIYGPNEAGKSTTLRAIEALLYGFEARSQDDHVHEGRRLRVGGALSTKGGARFEYVRRKGMKDTVLDAGGVGPVDDAPLGAMLGGTGREAFRAIYGLDHGRLRAGGQTLLEGDGRVGESLFAASMGVVHLHRVLVGLDAEASAIHAQRRGHELGKVLDAYDAAREQAKDDATSGDSVEEQRKQHEEKCREADALRERKHALDRERARLTRVKNVWQKLPEHERVTRLLEELGPPAVIDPAAREAAERDLAAAEPAVERLEKDLERALAERAAIELPAVLLAQSAEIERLWKERGAHVKAASDRVDKAEELERLEQKAREHAARLGTSRPDETSVEETAIDVSPNTQKKLRRAHDGLLRAETELETATARVRATERDAPPVTNRDGELEAIDAALAVAKDAPAVAARVDANERERARLDAKVRATLPALGLGPDPTAALGLQVPTEESARAEADAQKPIALRVAAIEARMAAHNARASEASAELDAVRARASVPAEDDLRRAREERDVLVDRLSRGEKVATETARAVARADAVADAMRMEAATVSSVAALEREVTLERARAEEAGRELGPARAELERRRAAWAEAWARSGLAPRSPDETIAWLRDLEAARAWCTSIVEIDADLARDRAKLDALRGDLEAVARVAHKTGVDVLVETLRARRETIAGDRRAFEGAEKARREALADAQAKRERLDAAASTWGELSEAAGLGCAAKTSDTESALAELDALAAVRVQIDGLRKRLRDIDRDADVLFVALASVVRTAAPDLAPDRLESLETLYARHAKATQDQAVADKLDADVRALRAELEAARAKGEIARGVLARLVEAAGVADVAALRSTEERTLHVRELRTAHDKLEADLAHLGDGLALEVLRREAAAFGQLEDVRARLEEVEEQYQQTSDELERTMHSAAGIEAGLRSLDEPRASAAESATRAETFLARGCELGERWLRLRLAHAVLQRAVDRMRAASQGPVIARASELFCALTLGAFARLEVAVDDRDVPVLLAVREGGDSVGMTGLSDGTRDQLYMALRVASLERAAKDGDPLPLVLDDVLVDFDDDRARAALVVLAGLAHTMQVLLFTHHARVAELAREAVADVALVLLPSASVAPAA